MKDLKDLYKIYKKAKGYSMGGSIEGADLASKIKDDEDLTGRKSDYNDAGRGLALKEEQNDDNEDDINDTENDDNEDDTDTSDDSEDQLESTTPTEEPDGKLEVGSTKTEPQKNKSDVASLIASLKSSDPNDLEKAQKERDMNIAGQQIMKGTTLMSAGMLHADPSQTLKVIGEQDQYAGLPVQKYHEHLENQQYDPNSEMSQTVRNYLKGKGIPVSENASAADIAKINPSITKDQQLQALVQRATLNAHNKLQVAADNQASMNKRAEERNKISQQKADAATKNAESNKGLKAQAGQDRSLQQTKTLLESARGNPAASQAEKDLYAVNKVKSLLKVYPDPDKMPEAQVNLVISEIGKIAQGGVPTGHEIDALKPGSAEGKLQALWGQLTNKPTPANAGAYLKEFNKYNKALESDAQQVIKDKYGRVIESSKKQLGEDNYKSLQDQYLNRFSQKDFTSDVTDYAKTHNITPEQAQAIKDQRTGK